MTQYEVLNLDNNVAVAVEASTQEREDNRRKKNDQAEALARETNCKRQERWNKTVKEKKKEKFLRDRMRYAAKKKAITTAVHTNPVRKTPEEIKEYGALVERRRPAAKKKATEKAKAKKSNAKKQKNNDVSTSSGTTSSSTTQPCPVIEEHALPVNINPYHVSKSQKDQRSRDTSQSV